MKDNVMHNVRLAFIIFMVLVAVWFLTPTVRWYLMTTVEEQASTDLSVDQMLEKGFDDAKIRSINKLKNLRREALNLGLDLQGGMRITLQADFEDYALKLEKDAKDLTQMEKDDAINRLIERLRSRIDQFGVSESPLRRQGDDRVVIELPGVKDPDRVREFVATEGILQFRFVDMESSRVISEDDMLLGEFTNEAMIPSGTEVLYYYSEKDEYGRRLKGQPVFVETNVIINGDMLKYAQATFDEYGEIVVSFELNAEGARVFADATSENIGEYLGIILDNKRVISAPVIQGAITLGRGQISGNFTEQEANDLASILREGALPLRVHVVEQDIVGEAIGSDSVKAGTNALIWAVVLVMIYMVIMYRASGLIADTAMLINILLIIAVLSPLGFTLTLPGIAGLVLTVGMAVDANVIIFERIREELRSDKPFAEGINAGFERAFWTILDSNVTTLIAAFVLWAFGSGPVQGFAVTLFFGVLMNLFTALFLTRFVYEQIVISNLVTKRNRLFI